MSHHAWLQVSSLDHLFIRFLNFHSEYIKLFHSSEKFEYLSGTSIPELDTPVAKVEDTGVAVGGVTSGESRA